MSLDRIPNNIVFKQDFNQVTLGTDDDSVVFGDNQVEENYSDIFPVDNSVSSQQVNLSSSSDNSLDTSASPQEQLNQALTDYLENIVLAYEEQFASVKDNNGIIAKGWDWFKNLTGIGAGSDKVQDEINKLKEQIEKLKKDSSKINDVYKSVTGNELNDEELNNLINGQVDLSNSPIIESVSKYTQGQKMCTNIISGIGSSLAVVGLIAGGIVAAPFTGGMSLGASAAAIGTLTAAGTAAYMVPQVIDGVTEKDGYSFKEGMQDVANGVVNSAFTAVGMGAGKAVGTALGKTAVTQAGKTAAGLASAETTSLIIGDGIGIGNYLTEAAFNDDVDFSWSDLGKTAAVSTASSLVAGATAFGISSTLRPALTAGTTAQSQIIGRLVSAGITGGSAGMSAAAVGGGTNYLLTCAINGKEVSFDEWLNASTENLASAALSGVIGGMAFEAVHLAAGTPKPEGTVKSVKGTNEDGLKYINYLDKDGNVLATDISVSDVNKIYGNNNEQGLTQYDSSASSNGKVYDTTRTFRISYTNIPDVQSLGGQDGMEVFTQSSSDNYRADITAHDWADNAFYLGSGVVNESNIPNPNIQKNVVNANYEVINDDAITAEFNGNTINTPQLTEGTPITKDNGLVSLQSDNTAQPANFNSQNIDMVVDTTLAQLAAQQVQMANIQAQTAGVQAQTQGAVISANAVAAGIVSSVAGGNNIPQPVEFTAGSASSNDEINQKFTQTDSPYLNSIIDPEIAQEINLLPEEQYQTAIELVNAGMTNIDGIKQILSLPEEHYQTAVELVKNGIMYLDIIEDICLILPKNQHQEAIELAKIGMTNIDDIIVILSLPEEYHQTAFELVKTGITNRDDIKLLCSCTKEQQQSFIEFIKEYKDKEYSFEVQKLQNNAGVQIVAIKEVDSNDSLPDDYVKTIKTVTLSEDGTIKKSTAEIPGDKIETWYYGQDRTVILNKINDGRDISSQIEIVNNEDGEPSYIIYTKASDTLEGAYETTRYDLSDYPEDMDVIEAIENGTIQGGKVLSSVSSENGVTQYQENYEYEGSDINRNYTQEVDETGKVESYEYKYDIIDTEGKQLLSMERSWEINPDGTTTTVVNGKKYTASFDEDNMIVIITQDDGSSTTIDFKSKLSSHVPYDFNDEETMQKAFFEFIKTMPGDQIMNLSKCPQITIVDNAKSSIDFDNNLKIGLCLEAIVHEMGHSIDALKSVKYAARDYENKGNISGNQELIDIYNEEMTAFKSKYPELAQELIRYFAQTGGSGGTGLAEIVAETNMLMTTYGNKDNRLKTRSEYLVRYFPKTVAKIAEILGYNFNLSPEVKEVLTQNAENIHQTTLSHINEAINQIENEFSNLPSINGKVQGRAKGIDSILTKLEKKYKSGDVQYNSAKSCTDAIGDAYGTRIQLKSVTQEEAKKIIEGCLYNTGISYEEFVSYLDGDTSTINPSNIEKIEEIKFTVLDLLKEQQTHEVVERLVDAIGNGRLKITELNNYGDDIASYFTARQIQDIADAYYIATGEKLNIISLDRFNNGSGSKVDINSSFDYTINLETDGAVKQSGYASAQMNVEHTFTDGTAGHGELQIRGTLLNNFADAEHIPYDIRTGKITAEDTEYSDIYNIIKNMSDETYKEYNQFLTATYKYLRLQELGIETTKPVFETSSLTSEELHLLSPEGLIEIKARKH